MKSVFLDFDGPIIPIMSHKPAPRKMSEKAWPPCVKALNRITDATGANIVVSSTWRADGLPKVRGYLKDWGVTGRVIGITPSLEQRRESGLWEPVPRGLEIAEYIKNWNLFHPNNEITQFVIFDDDKDMDYLMPFLIHTPFETGITERHADLAIERLGEGEKPLGE